MHSCGCGCSLTHQSDVLFDLTLSHQEKCTLTFTGKAKAGQYFIYLMAEDLIPVPKISQVTNNKPLSAVPVHLSLTGESVNQMEVMYVVYKSTNVLVLPL